jgi:hypothetical protein
MLNGYGGSPRKAPVSEPNGGPQGELARMPSFWRHKSAAVATSAARIRIHQKANRLKDQYLNGEIEKAE